MNPNIKVYDNKFQLSKSAADWIVQAIQRGINRNGRFLIALSGGETPMETYRLLAEEPYTSDVDWGKVIFFWSDERCVDPDSSESNYRNAMSAFIEQLTVPLGHIHRILGERGSQAAAAAYDEMLRSYSLDSLSIPSLDLVMLGLGEDGHTASIFPNSPLEAFGNKLAIGVNVEYQGKPSERVTLTPNLINASRTILFMVTGLNKAAAVQTALKGDRDLLRWPAQRIDPTPGEIFWMLDSAAASKLG